jgi:hypothetical protein
LCFNTVKEVAEKPALCGGVTSESTISEKRINGYGKIAIEFDHTVNDILAVTRLDGFEAIEEEALEKALSRAANQVEDAFKPKTLGGRLKLAPYARKVW